MCVNAIAGNKSNTKKAPWGGYFFGQTIWESGHFRRDTKSKNNRNLNGVVGADGIEPPTFCV